MASEGVSHGLLISLGGVTEGVKDFVKDKSIGIIDADAVIRFNKWILDYYNYLIPEEKNT